VCKIAVTMRMERSLGLDHDLRFMIGAMKGTS